MYGIKKVLKRELRLAAMLHMELWQLDTVQRFTNRAANISNRTAKYILIMNYKLFYKFLFEERFYFCCLDVQLL